jgi:hypothetical protein
MNASVSPLRKNVTAKCVSSAVCEISMTIHIVYPLVWRRYYTQDEIA